MVLLRVLIKNVLELEDILPQHYCSKQKVLPKSGGGAP